MGESQSQAGCLGEKQNLLPLLEMEPQFQRCQDYSVHTTLTTQKYRDFKNFNMPLEANSSYTHSSQIYFTVIHNLTTNDESGRAEQHQTHDGCSSPTVPSFMPSLVIRVHRRFEPPISKYSPLLK